MLTEKERSRFFSKVDKTDSCWNWSGSTNHKGYGKVNLRRINQSSWSFAHRISYQEHYGDIDPNQQVLHSCDNPACVNPEHLHEGTHQENMDEMVERGRWHSGPTEW